MNNKINTGGVIYVVATPIGNLEDITLRALNTLKEADFLICEDTRVTQILLDYYKIEKKYIVINAQNEQYQLKKVINQLKTNLSCALVSDAGTPVISDPGSKLISEAIKNDIKVIPIPGPSALTAALSVSGFPANSFLFEGFLPHKKGRQKKLQELASEERTIVIYESTYRIVKLLEEINMYMPSRKIIVARELTKKFEEFWRGTANEILSSIKTKIIKGEFVVVIAPKNFK